MTPLRGKKYLLGEKAVVGRSSRLHSRSSGRVAPPYHAKKIKKIIRLPVDHMENFPIKMA
jgi:hypothetical protein